MRRLLVVEDDPDVRDALAECLADSGFAVTTASDGAAGLECLRAQRIDLVLLDLVMPGMDGQRFMAELRKLPHAANVPVIVTTGVTTARVPGAEARLDKPFDIEALLSAVRSCLGAAGRDAALTPPPR